jgi:predicted RNase H-like nuclease
VRILGADLSGESAEGGGTPNTLALLDDGGRVSVVRHPTSLPDLAAMVAELTHGEPFVLGVNLPLVAPARTSKFRPVDNLVRRRFGYRLAPIKRTEAPHGGATGAAVLGALAATGSPCLSYPDRDRRESGLAEVHPGLVIKSLLWESAPAALAPAHPFREEAFRAYAAPAYRASAGRVRSTWAETASRLDLLLRALQGTAGFDLTRAREVLAVAATEGEVARAGSILDASLLAGTARRYLDSPETCVFLGDPESGYTILPANGFIRKLGLRDGPPKKGQLFPRTSLRERLGVSAELRALELLAVPGRPQRLEAVFRDVPLYEFDNVDEMMWWKHCRHLSGPAMPTEGLQELAVELDPDGSEGRPVLRLVRSRHRTLSFRFDPPDTWRLRLPTRDGKTYPFRVLRANYDVLPAAD